MAAGALLPLRGPYTHPLTRPRPLVFRTDPTAVLDLQPTPGAKWVDRSGKGNHGAVTGAVQKAKDPRGFAWSFDGDDYIDCGVDSSLVPTSALTLAFWVESTWDEVMADTAKYLVGQYYTSYAFNYSPGLDKLVGYINEDAISWASPTNGRHHIALTYGGGKKLLYVDGEEELAEDQSGNVTAPTYHFGIGHLLDADGSPVGDRGFIGSIDEVLLLHRVMGPDEIKALYEAGR